MDADFVSEDFYQAELSQSHVFAEYLSVELEQHQLTLHSPQQL